jgi:hypothetical protein
MGDRSDRDESPRRNGAVSLADEAVILGSPVEIERLKRAACAS